MTTKNMHATSGAAIKGYQSLFFTLALALMLVLGAEQILTMDEMAAATAALALPW